MCNNFCRLKIVNSYHFVSGKEFGWITRIQFKYGAIISRKKNLVHECNTSKTIQLELLISFTMKINCQFIFFYSTIGWYPERLNSANVWYKIYANFHVWTTPSTHIFFRLCVYVLLFIFNGPFTLVLLLALARWLFVQLIIVLLISKIVKCVLTSEINETTKLFAFESQKWKQTRNKIKTKV